MGAGAGGMGARDGCDEGLGAGGMGTQGSGGRRAPRGQDGAWGPVLEGRVVQPPGAHGARFPQGGLPSEMEWVWALVLLAALGSARAERDCRVSSFRVKENFDKARVGTGVPGAPRSPFPEAGQALPDTKPGSPLFPSSPAPGTPWPRRTPRACFCKTTSSPSSPWTRMAT